MSSGRPWLKVAARFWKQSGNFWKQRLGLFSARSPGVTPIESSELETIWKFLEAVRPAQKGAVVAR